MFQVGALAGSAFDSQGRPVLWDGRAVTWSEWDPSPLVTHLSYDCETCGATCNARAGDTSYACGVIDPAPGDRWRIARFGAWRCETCGQVTVYDRTDAGTGWEDITDASSRLF